MGKLFSWLKRNMLRLIVGSIVGSIIGGTVGAIVGAIVGLVFFGGGATIAVVLVFFEIGNVIGGLIGAWIRRRSQST